MIKEDAFKGFATNNYKIKNSDSHFKLPLDRTEYQILKIQGHDKNFPIFWGRHKD